jgi:aspartate aminotransferase
MAVAKRIKEMMSGSSWIRRMFEAGLKLKAVHGTDSVCDFSLGNPNLAPPAAFTRELLRVMGEEIPGKHGYMPNAGYPEVRESVAAHVSREQKVALKGEHVILSCGAGGGLNVAMKTILNPGDVVIASVPYFFEYSFYAENHGGMVELVRTKEDFDLDVEEIARHITPKTAAVIINSPNNPSGQVYPAATIEALCEMLGERSREVGRSIYLLSDEPYRRIVYDGVSVPPILPRYRNSVVITSCSKDLSVPGERIGWIAVHPQADDLVDLVNGMILCTRILGFVNAPSLMQRVVARTLGESVDVDVYKKKRDMLCRGLESFGYEFLRPKGTFYLLPKAPGGDDLGFVEALQRELILTVPGRGFALPGYFRIAFCVEDRVIEKSLEGFSRAIGAFGKAKMGSR